MLYFRVESLMLVKIVCKVSGWQVTLFKSRQNTLHDVLVQPSFLIGKTVHCHWSLWILVFGLRWSYEGTSGWSF